MIDDDPLPQLPPLSPAQVARRALVLSAVMCRGFIDNEDQHEAEALRTRIIDWLTRLDLWDEVEPDEEKLLRADVGTLDEKNVVRTTWYAEGLVVLSWALNQFKFPRHDQQVSGPDVAESLWFLCEDAEEFIDTATLRDASELEACRVLLYDIHCRLRDFLRNGGKKDFTRWVEPSWIEALGLDPACLIVQGDLAIDGIPVSEVERDRVRECETITCERHRAIIWLVERDPDNSVYSEIHVDT